MSIELGDIQGIVLGGYGRLPYARFLLCQFGEADAARTWLGRIVGQIRSGDSTPPVLEPTTQIAFTFAGCEHLELSWQALKGFSREFREGMAGSPRRSRLLGDTDSNAPDNWKWGADERVGLHALLMLYAPTAAALDVLTDTHETLMKQQGIDIINRLEANRLPDNKEHFGFLDGLSQPKIKGISSATAPHEVVNPGEFILGLENERGGVTTRPLIDAIEDPDDLLPRTPEQALTHDFGRHGSYLIVRQLSQDVAGFWSWAAAASPDTESSVHLAAKMVGRWPDGAPLTTHAQNPKTVSTDNDFLYHKTDRFGAGCPIGAHIRRTNPRDSLAPKPGSDESLSINRRHRLLRRGRPYGPPLTPTLDVESLLGSTDDGQERGLHFMCLAADISRQFEFVQATWINNANFAGLTQETDPIMGKRSVDSCAFTIPADPVRKRHHELPEFVGMQGGAYFFLPGLRALRYMASPPRKIASAYSAPASTPTLVADNFLSQSARGVNSLLEWIIASTKRWTTLRNAFDRVFQRPLMNAAQWLLRWRRKRYRIDADLAIAEERIIPGEDAVAQQITEQMTAFLYNHYRHSTAERAGNTKTYGLFEASFEVHDVGPELRKGLFKEPATYTAWVRFGGPGPLVTPDIKDNGILSIGVKICGIDAPTLLDDEQGTQDFSGISAPTFTTPDVVENLKLQQCIGAGISTWYFLNPLDSHVMDMLMQGLYAKAHGSPFTPSYHSCVPYLYGDSNAFKYRFEPRVPQQIKVPFPAPPNYLREAMQKHFREATEVLFDFKIQLQECPMLMPIEDASIIWRSPEVTVATLRIPRQNFNTPERELMARELTINPWHAVADHRPLGNQNRARRTIYYETARIRQRMNREQHKVPQ